ncbi:DUF302 domain-containing protein [Acuticoccus sp. MNP-M23]|uniref:DUF302 domain-containing protein n=1 Tax=Acuticoccus sp. MNP-M23 TaxID=3072793 RepID=UPI002814CFEC|nr:DUF302 domain-containing protein [Acuticoccus sp. MNP-M23]WMS41020.1 DUF302 domain-containing protein [Acuticoccus sp. MNP-M23]
MRTFAAAALALLIAAPAHAASVLGAPDGWSVTETDKDYATLLADLKAAVTANKMGIVTEAGPTEMAESRGETIPGNRVVGVFRNDLAVAIIRAAPAAMIEAPVRFMVMEEPDGTATLAYKYPSTVFAPYAEAGGDALDEATGTLDEIFDRISDQATGN